MPAPKKTEAARASELVQARLTSAEREALNELLDYRAHDLEKHDLPPDTTFAGWLRWMIRREAKALGVEIESALPPLPARSPKKPR